MYTSQEPFLKHLNVATHIQKYTDSTVKDSYYPQILKIFALNLYFPAYSTRVSAVEILGGISNKKFILFYPIKDKSVHPLVKARCHGNVPSSGMEIERKAEFSKKKNWIQEI